MTTPVQAPADRPTPARAAPAPAIRWAGAVLAAASLALIACFLLYITAYGAPTGTGAGGAVTIQDRAGHVLSRWSVVSWIWLAEALAWVGLGVAGFTLQRRERAGPGWLPGSAAWVILGVGALIQSIMYAFMLGGYPAAAGAAGQVPALLEAFNGAAMFLFGLGNMVVFLGQAGVLLSEARPGGVIARPVALAGGVVCLIEVLLFAGVLLGVVGMMAAGPGALLATIVMVYLGIAIAQRG